MSKKALRREIKELREHMKVLEGRIARLEMMPRITPAQMPFTPDPMPPTIVPTWPEPAPLVTVYGVAPGDDWRSSGLLDGFGKGSDDE